MLYECGSFRTLKERHKNFIINAFICFSSIKGKINFLQLGRFSNQGNRIKIINNIYIYIYIIDYQVDV